MRRRQGACPLARLPMVALDRGFAAGGLPTRRGYRLSAPNGRQHVVVRRAFLDGDARAF